MKRVKFFGTLEAMTLGADESEELVINLEWPNWHNLNMGAKYK